MEKALPGLVGTKFDLKKFSSGDADISDGINNARVIRRRISRIPIFVKRNGPNGLKNLQPPHPANNGTRFLHFSEVRSDHRSKSRQISVRNPPRHLDEIDDATGRGEDENVPFSNKEESAKRLDEVNNAGRAEDVKLVKVDDSENNRDRSDAVTAGERARKLLGKSKTVIKRKEEIKKEGATPSMNHSPKQQNSNVANNTMNSCSDPIRPVHSGIKDEIINDDGLNNNTVDFIEMLTLDAEQFLNTKCVCAAKTAEHQHFCKDCFRNSKQEKDLMNGDDNKTFLIDPCEPDLRRRDNDFKSNITKHEDDEIGKIGEDICNDCVNESSSSNSNNNGHQSDNSNEASVANINEDKTTERDKDIEETSQLALEKISSEQFEESPNKVGTLNFSMGNNCENLFLNLLSPELMTSVLRNNCTGNILKPFNEKSRLTGCAINNCLNPFRESETPAQSQESETSPNNIKESYDSDLDPKPVLQHLVNPTGSILNSSKTFPSSSSSGHRRPSAYGESCASPESIGTDGRQQEQAPVRSRESAADVVVSDAPGRRVSQDFNPAAVADSPFLTGTCGSGPKPNEDANEHRQQLTWGFENGRLVFAESKSNLEESTLDREQVVCASGGESSTLVTDRGSSTDVRQGAHSPIQDAASACSQTSEEPSIAHANDELEPPVYLTTQRSTDGITVDLNKDLLSSKHINKRSDGCNSRLKLLENKLKKAGITDASKCDSTDVDVPTCKKNYKYNSDELSADQDSASLKIIGYSDFQKECSDVNGNNSNNNNNKAGEDRLPIDKENSIEGEDLIPDGSHDFCQFDVSDFSGFSVFSANQTSGVYDEFVEDSTSSSEESCECDEEEHFIVIRRTRGDGIAMVNDSSERNKHNPDRDNLKSLLKKPGRAKGRKSNRVVFNEHKNEFFDADYIILIREDCELEDDDDDGICTCQQHEMVRLTCCEPNCNCQFEQEPTPQSPKFAPPMEFVDAVTLSPPEGYKDMELMAATRVLQQRGPVVCRECSATHDEQMEDDGEISQSDSEMDGQMREQEEKEKTDQSQQTTPTTPPSTGNNSSNQNYMLETLSTTKTNQHQQQIHKEAEEAKRPPPSSQGSPISGILKGGRLWKQQAADVNFARSGESNLVPPDAVASDDEGNNRRSVRFIESEEKETRDSCDGAPESSPEEEILSSKKEQIIITESQTATLADDSKHDVQSSSSPEAPEMTLTFKLGNHVLISNNSLKPNSAVRQLFPCTKSLAAAQGVPEEENNSQQYLVTAESLRAFEEAKRSKLPQIIQSGETDETIKRAIERNTLRRSLIRYEPRSKKQPYKSDNSLVERIKQLTCDVDDNTVNAEQNQSSIESSDPSEDVLDSRSSPPGEESRNSPDVNTLSANNKGQDKSFSPSSSSTGSSNSSMSINQTYSQTRKLSATGDQILMMDHVRVESMPDIQNNFRREVKPLPDIGGPHNHDLSEPSRAMANPPDLSHYIISNKMSSSSNTSESRRQFLSTLAPLTACVTMGIPPNEDYYYHLTNSGHHNQPGERISVASSGTEYSLEDIDEGLKTEDEERKRIAPDVLAGTPSASESGDELAMFVQQDAGRIERIKKKYQPAEQQPRDNKNNDEDDEHDDYGFNRRPSVRGIKPRFSTTTEILQQIQNQLQPPAPPSARVAWPYYSESGLTDNSKQKNANQNASTGNYHYVNVAEEPKTRGYPPQYRPTSLQEESLYQNCANQRCASRDAGAVYQRSNANVYQSVIRMGNDYYQSLPLSRQRNSRPQSPPPTDMSKQYHQTMVYIPYNHIEGYQPVQYYHHTGTSDYVTRVSSQNQINKRYIEPVYQSRGHHHVDDHVYSSGMIPPVPPKALNRVPYPNGQPPPHMMGGSRSESPSPGQFSTARATQTPAPAMSTCGYYTSNPRYRPVVGSAVWQGEGNYATKLNRHSFPSVGPPRYPPADSISLTDSDSQHSGSLPNGYRQSDISLYVPKDSIPNSPTKPRFIERGVPEGAASVSPQDISGVSQSSSSTMTSPTSPQNPPVPTNQKAMFYAMNV